VGVEQAAHPEISRLAKEAFGLSPDDEIVAFVYLGYLTGGPCVRATPLTRVTYLDE
jgi:hypothetical protein